MQCSESLLRSIEPRRSTHSLGELVGMIGEYGTGFFSENLRVDVEEYSNGEAGAVECTIVIPVYNQVDFIDLCLDHLNERILLRSDLVVVSDSPTDGTTEQVRSWIKSVTCSGDRRFARIALALPEASVFETLCDTIGFALSRSPYAIEIQADMLIEDPGFDVTLVNWLKKTPGLLAVGGRGAHTFGVAGLCSAHPSRVGSRLVDLLYRQVAKRFGPRGLRPFAARFGNVVGRFADLIETSEKDPRHDLFLHDTVMRGPLAMDLNMLRSLGGFDTRQFFLGGDDHELAHRAWKQRSWRVGYCPIAFESPLDVGTTRRKRTEDEQAEYLRVRTYYTEAQAALRLNPCTTTDCRRPPRSRLPGARSGKGLQRAVR